MKKTSTSDKLAIARNDLTAAKKLLVEILEDEGTALSSADEYSAWTLRRDVSHREVDRLGAFIASLQEQSAQEQAEATEKALRARYALKRKENVDLAARIRSNVAQANRILLDLLREVAASSAEDTDINAALPDVDPLVPADVLARTRQGLPREEISRERVSLWVKKGTDFIIGDQDDVEVNDKGRGIYRTGMGWTPCERVVFDKVEYHSAEPIERALPLLKIQVLHSDRPGFAYDGSQIISAQEALALLNRDLNVTKDRSVEIELTPVEPAQPVSDAA